MAAATGVALSAAEAGFAGRYARSLLRALDIAAEPKASIDSPALANARCGLQALTGPGDASPRMPPAPLSSCAQGALAALAALPGGAALAGLDAAALLGERAACNGLSRAGDISPGGGCRLLACADGWLAVQLSREDDWALLPAWLEDESVSDWEGLSRVLRQCAAAPLAERAALLGLAAADCVPPRAPTAWYRRLVRAPRRVDTSVRPPLVLDMSSLWAGPLCSHLLQAMGARVIKLESRQRPDGARTGNAEFFDLLNAGKECVALDFGSAEGIDQLRALIARADIVIEAARPRALKQLGIDAERCVAEQPGLSWISLTGYGREGEAGMRAAYGDDAGAAAGLAWMMACAHGAPGFVGDAIADPLTGLHAALCAWSAWLDGEGGLWSLPLRDVVAHCIASAGDNSPAAVRARAGAWQAEIEAAGVTAQPPRARRPAGRAGALGADTQRVLENLVASC
ncbi:CoA transferase [Algiphilus aromaticivorans]|uniref:CoA transferase n=1 Tax=Algiphilus aromaticivorans TaxID=382454 RepID=UPI0006938F2E|nr:CoA transferase [Algiphilus aromaticivorans]